VTGGGVAEEVGAAIGEMSAVGLAEGTVFPGWTHETTMNATAIEVIGLRIGWPNLEMSRRPVI
jgi:hypothetical protein